MMTLGRKQKTCAGVGGVRSRRNFGVAGTRRDQDLLLKSPAAKPQPFVFDCVGADLRSLPGYRSGHRQTPSVRRPKGGNKMVVPLGRKARTCGGSPRDPSRPVPQPHLGYETATGASAPTTSPPAGYRPTTTWRVANNPRLDKVRTIRPPAEQVFELPGAGRETRTASALRAQGIRKHPTQPPSNTFYPNNWIASARVEMTSASFHMPRLRP